MRLKRLFLLPLLFILTAPALLTEPVIHVLQKGETIFGIAKKYSVPYEAVLIANEIEDPRKVFPGRKLLIPSSHKVVKGETLYGIAREYEVALGDLLKINKLASGAVIKPGDLLIIPGGVPSVAIVTAAPPSSPPADSTIKDGNTALSGPSKGNPSSTSVEFSVKALPSGTWPAQGEASYLEGKLFGIGIKTEENAQIRAVRAGTVVSAGPFRGFGRVAFIQAKDGLIYVYGGAQTLGVRIGETIRAGAEIGRVGIDLKEGRPIAYFLVFKQGNPLDPATVPRD